MAQLKAEASEAETQIGPSTRPQTELDFLSPSEHPDALGRLGPYEVLDVIGRGGMGLVLKAFEPSLQRTVAIKVLAPHLAAAEMNRKRFIREARAAAAVRHEHVVTVHAVDESGPLPYLVMEYVHGISLQDLIDRDGPPALEEVLRIGVQTASGLAAAHARGLIHRDIKPANILLQTPEAHGLQPAGLGNVKLTDFGLARAVDDVSLTQSGVVAGTPQYMAPEQARAETLDHRADLFSLGSVLYVLCTGKPPFGGDGTVAVLFNVCAETPRPVQELNPAIPDWLIAIVEKLHAKKPADRFQSAAEVAELLRQYLAHLQQPSRVPRPVGPERLTPEPVPVTIPPHLAWRLGREYRSKRTLWGWPLVHVASGWDLKTGRKRVAKGIIAIGDVAVGGLAVGGLAIGGIALGGGAVGLIALGGGALGLVLALGGMAVGSIALGGMAVGLVALGGMAVGYYALGGTAYGAHALGSNFVDPEALRFFRAVLPSWMEGILPRRP
jgi:serine/threonine protein kinase